MQTWEAITSRRNVRSFADRPIPAADLDQILEAGRRSPSSQNWQPWDFIVVTDRGQLRELARVWRGAGHVAGSAATIVVVGPAADNEFGRAGVNVPAMHIERHEWDIHVVSRGAGLGSGGAGLGFGRQSPGGRVPRLHRGGPGGRPAVGAHRVGESGHVGEHDGAVQRLLPVPLPLG
jgi:Nitroreductase family